MSDTERVDQLQQSLEKRPGMWSASDLRARCMLMRMDGVERPAAGGSSPFRSRFRL